MSFKIKLKLRQDCHCDTKLCISTFAKNVPSTFGFVNIQSDHDLMMMTFQVRLKKARKPNQPRLRFDL